MATNPNTSLRDIELLHTDQYLSQFAMSYKAADDVADFIAPGFRVNRHADKYVKYSKDAFRIYDNKLAPREVPKEINWKGQDGSYFCERYGHSAFIDNDELTNVDKPVDLEKRKSQGLKTAMMLAREKRVFAVAGSTALIPNTGIAAGWATASSGTPVENIKTACAAIYNATGGMKANRIVMGYEAALKASSCSEWKEYFKYTGSSNIWDLLAGLRNLGLDGRIAGAFGLNTNLGGTSDPAIETIWGDTVLVYYCEPTPSLDTMTFMYSPYLYKDQVIVTKEGEVKRQNGYTIDMVERIDELLVNASCGYLLTNVF